VNALSRPGWRLDRAWAVFVPRAILGFLYLFDGIHILTDAGALEFGRKMAASDGAGLLPTALLTAAGVLTPFLDLLLGTLVLLGFWTRPALRALGVLLIGITASYGIHGLWHPIGATAMNVQIVNLYILPRAALVMLVLFLPAEDDVLTLDVLLFR
jgi:uncharacterized membrane protein YphA (DoxX/SURF4 family)